MVSDRPERFVRDDPLFYSGKKFGGNLHMFYRGVAGSVTVQDAELLGEFLAHPDGMWVGGAVNVRHTSMDTLTAPGIDTRYDFYALGADVTSEMDVSGGTFGRDLVLEKARCGAVDASGADIDRYLNARGTAIDGDLGVAGSSIGRDVDLSGAAVRGDVDLRDTIIDHVLYLDEANIGGAVDLRGASLHGIYADDLEAYEFRFDDETVIGHVYTDIVDRYGQEQRVPVEHREMYETL